MKELLCTCTHETMTVLPELKTRVQTTAAASEFILYDEIKRLFWFLDSFLSESTRVDKQEQVDQELKTEGIGDDMNRLLHLTFGHWS